MGKRSDQCTSEEMEQMHGMYLPIHNSFAHLQIDNDSESNQTGRGKVSRREENELGVVTF